MLASSACEQLAEAGSQGAAATPDPSSFRPEEVGNSGYLKRHGREMFEDGRSFSGNERDKLFFNRRDGTFADLSDLCGADSPNDGRAVIACDFDDDGDVDLFVHELQRERHALYRNELGSRYGGFLKLRLRATSQQWEAIGAVVTVETDRARCSQPLARGSGFETCQPPELVFGLGPDAREARVQVLWPGGARDTWSLEAGGRYELVEGGAARELKARTAALPDPLPAGLKKRVGEKITPLAVSSGTGQAALLDPVALAQGGRLYLNLWASYCAPCIAELPLLERLHGEEGTSVVALSMDAPGHVETARGLLEKRGTSFPAYFLSTAAGGDGAAIDELIDLERLPLPTTIVLDAEGSIVEIIRGAIREEED